MVVLRHCYCADRYISDMQVCMNDIFAISRPELTKIAAAARSYQLRRRNRPFNQFFSISHPPPATGRPRRLSRTTGLPPLNEPLRPISLTHSMLYPPVSPLPSAYRADRRRTRAADTDEGGRRAGNPEDGNLDNKDILPAYDNVGGPPKYVEMNMGAGTPVHLALAGVVERLPINDTPGHEQDTPMQSAEEVASSSHSSVHSDSNLRPPEPPAADAPAAHQPA
jgi:hypothetical protein